MVYKFFGTRYVSHFFAHSAPSYTRVRYPDLLHRCFGILSLAFVYLMITQLYLKDQMPLQVTLLGCFNSTFNLTFIVFDFAYNVQKIRV